MMHREKRRPGTTELHLYSAIATVCLYNYSTAVLLIRKLIINIRRKLNWVHVHVFIDILDTIVQNNYLNVIINLNRG